MARPPLPIGTWGTITTKEVRPGVFRARARFRDADGMTRSVTSTGRTSAAARRELRQTFADRAAPAGDLISPEMRLQAVAEIWLALLGSERHIEQTTIDEYRRVVERVLNDALGSMRLREARAGRIERVILSQPTDSRRKKVKTVLGMMFDAAVRDGAIDVNPVRSTSRLRRTKTDVRVLDVADLGALRAAVAAWMTKERPGPRPSNDVPDIIDLMLATGCRIGEILAVRWSDVDLAAQRPTLAVSGTVKTEKGRGTYRKAKPKSDASIRTVTLPPFAVEVLLRRRVSEPANPRDAVFATRKGTWHQVGNIERRWRQIRRDTGFDWVTPHVFRKTVATLIDQVVDAETAARQLGHSSSDITTEFYIRKDRSAPDVSHVLEAFAAPREGHGPDRQPAGPIVTDDPT